jgi:polyisoprenoid-binding protein YceI
MKQRFLLGLLLWLCAGMTPAQTDIAESDIRFQIVNAGLTVTGTFSGLNATIRFNPAAPERAFIRASVPVNTIKTGIGLRDKHLLKPNYFDAEKYPNIVLESSAIRKTGANQFEGTFKLTIKGTQRQVTLPFTVSATNEFTGNLRLNRLDYNVGKSSLLLANDVDISIRAKPAKSL